MNLARLSNEIAAIVLRSIADIFDEL